jgi:PAS domain S-box-containing protein
MILGRILVATAPIGLTEQQAKAEMQPFYAEGDRLIGHYVLAHFLLAILLAGIHHTWGVTLIVSAAALGIFFVTALKSPRSFLTRCLGGVALQAFVALNIYQTHGMLETRYLFFPAMTMMVIYQDWACLLPATIVAVGERSVLLVMHYAGMHSYLYEGDYVTTPSVMTRFAIAFVHFGVCGYWAHLARQRTLVEAWQRQEMQRSREFITCQIERDRASALALEASERRYRLLADVIPQLVWTLDADGMLTYANERLIEYTGLRLQDLKDRYLLDLIHPEDRPFVSNAWKNAVERGDIYEIEHRIYEHRTGNYGWFLARGMPLRDAGGRVTTWLGTSTDITAKKRVEEALLHSNEDVQQFVYAASHDLQEPMRNISMFTELLARRYLGKLDAQADEYIQFCLVASRRMQKMIGGLLEFSRAGRVDVTRLTPTSATDALATSLTSLQSLIRESSAAVTSEPLPMVLSESSQLAQVFQNLIGNSIQYRSAAAPHIHFSAQRKATEWVIAVRDNGQGFRLEYAEKIFGLFKRLHGQDVPGAGVGLALSKRIIERQGGRIWVESSPGQGSTFYLSLHAAPDAPVKDGGVQCAPLVQRISLTFSPGMPSNRAPLDATMSK